MTVPFFLSLLSSMTRQFSSSHTPYLRFYELSVHVLCLFLPIPTGSIHGLFIGLHQFFLSFFFYVSHFVSLYCLQYCFLFFFFFLGHKAYVILAPQPGSNPTLCIERGSFNHWITREVPVLAPNIEIINLITISHFYLNFIWYVGNLNFYIIKMLSLHVYAFFYFSSLF